MAKLDILLQNFQTALEKLNIRRKHSIFLSMVTHESHLVSKYFVLDEKNWRHGRGNRRVYLQLVSAAQ